MVLSAGEAASRRAARRARTQRSIELGRPVIASRMKGVDGKKQSIALVSAASTLTTTMHRWVSLSLSLIRWQARASCSSEATCMLSTIALAVYSCWLSARTVGVRANTAMLSRTYAVIEKAMRIRALVEPGSRRSEDSFMAADPGLSIEKFVLGSLPSPPVPCLSSDRATSGSSRGACVIPATGTARPLSTVSAVNSRVSGVAWTSKS